MKRALSVAGVAILAVVGSCGVSPNDEPHDVSADQLHPALLDPNPSTSTTAGSPTVHAVTVYYLIQQEETTRLVAVTREVTDAERARDRLESLLSPPSEEDEALGIRSSIPADTMLLNTEQTAEGELTIDVSRTLFDIQGAELSNAFAQFVWTATELPTVQRVRFRVDGEEVRALDEEGTEQPGAVSRADYISLAPA